MILYGAGYVPESGIEYAYRYAPWRPLGIVAGAMAVVTLAIVLAGSGGSLWILAVVPMALTLLFFGLALHHWRHSLSNRDWFVKAGDTGLYINLAQAGRLPLSADAKGVAFVSCTEIAAVRLAKRIVHYPETRRVGRTDRTEQHAFVEIVLLHEDVAALERALWDIRRTIQGAARSALRLQGFRVHVADAPMRICLFWDRVFPSEQQAAAQLGALFGSAPEAVQEPPDWRGLDTDARQQFVLQLWLEGREREAELVIMESERLDRGQARDRLEAFVARA